MFRLASDNDWLMEEGWALFLVCLYILRLQTVGLIFPYSKGPILSDVGSKDLEGNCNVGESHDTRNGGLKG